VQIAVQITELVSSLHFGVQCSLIVRWLSI